MNIPKISALFETSLASSLSAAGSSFTVVSGTDRDGNALSGLYGFIIDEGSADEEFVIGTIASTTVTVVYRGIDADAPNTEVSGNKKAHRRGASVKITDYPILGVLRNIVNGDETLPNVLKYASAPTWTYGEQRLVTWDKAKDYADSLANTGAADASTTVQGLVEEATQAEVEAGTDVGATGAKLFTPNSKHGGKLYYGYAADAGANDTYTATLSPVPTAYTTGMVCVIKFNTINTGAATINLNGLGAKDIRKNNGLVLADGDIAAGQFLTLVYNGTYMELQSPIGKAQVSQSGAEVYAADSVGTDAYAVSLLPGPLAIVTGFVVRFKAGTANTGACTLSVNGSSAYAIKKNYNSDPATGDILQNQIVEVVFDGTNWQMLSPVAKVATFTNGATTKNIADASTTQTIAHGLGLIPKMVRLTASVSGTNGSPLESFGTYNGTTNACVYIADNGTSAAGSSTTNGIVLQTSAGNDSSGVITVDATNITITWTKTGTPTGTAQIMWEAQV